MKKTTFLKASTFLLAFVAITNQSFSQEKSDYRRLSYTIASHFYKKAEVTTDSEMYFDSGIGLGGELGLNYMLINKSNFNFSINFTLNALPSKIKVKVPYEELEGYTSDSYHPNSAHAILPNFGFKLNYYKAISSHYISYFQVGYTSTFFSYNGGLGFGINYIENERFEFKINHPFPSFSSNITLGAGLFIKGEKLDYQLGIVTNIRNKYLLEGNYFFENLKNINPTGSFKLSGNYIGLNITFYRKNESKYDF